MAIYTTGRSGYLALLVVVIFMAIKYIKINQYYYDINWIGL